MMLRNPNTITGCIIVLQIEHIGLEFNIKLFPFSTSLWCPRVAKPGGRQSRRGEGRGRLIVMIKGEPG